MLILYGIIGPLVYALAAATAMRVTTGHGDALHPASIPGWAFWLVYVVLAIVFHVTGRRRKWPFLIGL
jgi:hypothetical protein